MARKVKTSSTAAAEVERERPVDAFVEQPVAQENEPGSSRSGRISIRFDSEGQIDWNSMSESQKQRFAQVVSNDPTALEMIAGSMDDDGEGVSEIPFQVTENHVKMFLDLYAMGERFAIPAFLRVKSKGMVKIPPQIAAEVFQFSDEQKDSLAPSGAQWANENIPEWIRKYITEVGPGAQFFGGLAMITYAQTKAVLDKWKELNPSGIPGVKSETQVQ